MGHLALQVIGIDPETVILNHRFGAFELGPRMLGAAVDGDASAELGWPGAILYVFAVAHDECRPGLLDGESFHAGTPSLNKMMRWLMEKESSGFDGGPYQHRSHVGMPPWSKKS